METTSSQKGLAVMAVILSVLSLIIPVVFAVISAVLALFITGKINDPAQYNLKIIARCLAALGLIISAIYFFLTFM
ncbi:hypothetical protein ACFPU1_02705 [Thalassorhabdus alkalitolerans]|uniref:DUF4190 domain-containing protein n=2 Tax=Bacillaceae TaxID=186817 RepID=A0ABW0YH99_9BACI